MTLISEIFQIYLEAVPIVLKLCCILYNKSKNTYLLICIIRVTRLGVQLEASYRHMVNELRTLDSDKVQHEHVCDEHSCEKFKKFKVQEIAYKGISPAKQLHFI